ncbi:MAG: GDSL-type esterase/lipase family protein [Candidatus Thiodiazotropha sp.]
MAEQNISSELLSNNNSDMNDSVFENSTIDIEKDTTDYFDGIFYHIIPSTNKTHIMFYSKPLFNNVIQVLRKEFLTPEESSTFVLTTHIDGGKKCNIHVDLNEMTFVISGQGHTMWLEVNFRKMAIAMYRNFVNDIDSSLLSINNKRTSTPALSVSDDEEFFDIDMSMNVSGVEEISMELNKVNQLSDIMDKIRSVQKQLSDLTAQVNKLVAATYQKKLNQSVEEISPQKSEVAEVTSPQNSSVVEISNSNVSESLLLQSNAQNTFTKPRNTNDNKDTSQTKNKQQKGITSVSNQQPSSGNKRTKSTQPRTTTNRSLSGTLMIGDSILHGVNVKGLKSGVQKHAVSGAKIDNLLVDIKMFDLNKFSTVIIYVGGNDASSGMDPEYFEEKYEQLLIYIKKQNVSCKVILCSSCPRFDVEEYEMCEINDVVMRLARVHGYTFADMYSSFHEKNGNVCERFYKYDSVHINPSGIKRLLRVLHDIEEIVMDFEQCSFPKRSALGANRMYSNGQQKRRSTANTLGSKQKCYKCGESNHTTRACRHKNQIKCYDCHLLGHKSSLCENKF